MNDVVEILTDNIKTVFTEEFGLHLESVHIEHPEKENWGDYATNICLLASKVLKQSPMEIAKKLVYRLEKNNISFELKGVNYPIINNITTAFPGFVNFKLSTEWLQNVLSTVQVDIHGYKSHNILKNKRIALEHSNVNPNKATHVGHLRNAAIGQFIERVYEYLGYNVEVQYYNNDLGVQAVTSYLASLHLKDIYADDYAKYDHYAWDIYSQMDTLIAENKDLFQKRADFMLKVENQTSEEFKGLKKFTSKVLHCQLQTFQNLGFDYDVIINESDIIALRLWEAAFDRLKGSSSVYKAVEGKSKDCWLVKVAESKNEQADIEQDKIIVRSNGIPTYTGRDIAYHMWKFGLLEKDFGYEKLDIGTQDKTLWSTTSTNMEESEISFTAADIVYDVIDVRQTYAIDVVKKSLQYLGYNSQAENMRHINYGFVYVSKDTAGILGIDTSDGRKFYAMSGRKGWGVKIDDFIDMVDEKLIKEYGNAPSLQKVRNAAIKFEMLKSNTFQDLIFDLAAALNIKGYTGPYLLYTYARCFSVLAKANYTFVQTPFAENLHEREVDVLKWLYRFSEVVEASAYNFAPNLLCNYLYILSQKYNSFYAELPILGHLDSTDKKCRDFRLLLTNSVSIVLKTGVSLLGIDVVEKM